MPGCGNLSVPSRATRSLMSRGFTLPGGAGVDIDVITWRVRT